MFQEKLGKLKERFAHFRSNEERYLYLMQMGKQLAPLSLEERIPSNLVPGCQSLLYLSSTLLPTGQLFFRAYGEALISAGLASLLIEIYSGETAESILQNKPTFLQELHILSSLSPSRSNGAMSLYHAMQKHAVAALGHLK